MTRSEARVLLGKLGGDNFKKRIGIRGITYGDKGVCLDLPTYRGGERTKVNRFIIQKGRRKNVYDVSGYCNLGSHVNFCGCVMDLGEDELKEFLLNS